ncbi:hypothetical protein BD309DRAFT_1017704 [Dichomitus squalens]|uniref:Uncharacterized protein n=1 Tax=Dichomitus squalens TaxID=114155 RepID=A0A4Q9NV50_9APHY|nr:hypothetical protein BD311DRAFT_656648 [Dichomitus squalens]TBU45629.1 hypothetical protein BD309DRAFT_1017704 [Dichomitus squalens]TBU58314.1 hypothetical protein BD310DRAFT_948822 [Dichomitus squalens]
MRSGASGVEDHVKYIRGLLALNAEYLKTHNIGPKGGLMDPATPVELLSMLATVIGDSINL